MLAELEELGMQLARATAAKALAELAEPDPPQEAAEEPLSEPLAAEPPPVAAEAATPRRTAPRSPGSPHKTDPVQSFIRLAKAVCELIALESGLAAGPATKTGLVSPALRADPRRDPLLKAFREVTEHTQDRSAVRYGFTTRLDQELAADPEQILSLPEIFYPLCQEFGIELDVSKLSDEIIGMDPPSDDDEDPYRMNPPNPRATSPP
jgi:hypothetical protein